MVTKSLRITHYRKLAGGDPVKYSRGTTEIKEVLEAKGPIIEILIGRSMTRVHSIIFEGGAEWDGKRWVVALPEYNSPATLEELLRLKHKKYTATEMLLIRLGWNLAMETKQ